MCGRTSSSAGRRSPILTFCNFIIQLFCSIDLFQERVEIAIEVTKVEVITIDGEEEVTIIFFHSVNLKFQEEVGVEQALEQEAPECPICLATVNIGDEVK